MRVNPLLRLPSFGKTFSPAVSQIQSFIRSRSATHFNRLRQTRGLRIIAIACAALVLGLFADQRSSRTAIEGWLATHLPPDDVVTAVFEMNGLREIKKPEIISRAQKSLALSWDQVGAFWVSSDPFVIAWSRGEVGGSGRYMFFSRETQVRTFSWTRLGIGWPALEDLLARMKGIPKPVVTRPVLQPYRDPREIAY